MQYKKINHYQLIQKFERKKKANWLGELGLGEIFLFSIILYSAYLNIIV